MPGDNKIAKIDETAISKKWKHNGGRYYPEIWIIARIEREIKLSSADLYKQNKRNTD